MNLIDHLNWRYATKMFHPALKIGATDLAYLKEAVRLAVSSYGLQLYKVLIVENQEIRQELRKASWLQVGTQPGDFCGTVLMEALLGGLDGGSDDDITD